MVCIVFVTRVTFLLVVFSPRSIALVWLPKVQAQASAITLQRN